MDHLKGINTLSRLLISTLEINSPPVIAPTLKINTGKKVCTSEQPETSLIPLFPQTTPLSVRKTYLAVIRVAINIIKTLIKLMELIIMSSRIRCFE